MNRLAILLYALLMAAVTTPTAHAIGVDPDMLEDPAQEARARQLMKDLRCLVCQNQSIENSNATLARDLRQIVRQRVAAGDSDAQVRTYLVDRYGEWVLMRPPMNMGTILLWFGPGLLLIAGGLSIWLTVRKRRTADAPALLNPAPLNDDEQARLRNLGID